MNLRHVFSYLVPPGKQEEAPSNVRGTAVPLAGAFRTMLSDVFRKSDEECTISIRFVRAEDGSQQNAVRTLLLQFLNRPTLDRGLSVALRLHTATGSRSGLGLLFLLAGEAGADHKIVVSRFPAHEGVLAEARRGQLELEFVEKVFMKNAATYKAANYKGRSLDSGFWHGTVVDKQLSFAPHNVANYWVREFLLSDFKTTPKAGTRRLAIALREAAKAVSSIDAKHEIASVVTLLPGLDGRIVSPVELMEQFGLSNEVREALTRKLGNEEVLMDAFQVDSEEFRRNAAYRAVDLSTGGTLSAPVDEFDAAFRRETIDAESHTVRYVAEGQVVDERIKRQK